MIFHVSSRVRAQQRAIAFVAAALVVAASAANADEHEGAAAAAAEQAEASEAPAEEAADEAAERVAEEIWDAIDDHAASYGIATDEENWRLMVPPPPPIELDEAMTYFWVLETSVGELRFELFPDVAPNHVINAIYLSQVGFYDGLRFHRIVSGMIAQAGCPLNKGVAGPAYSFDGEFTDGPRSKHSKAGLLSMANKNKPGTDGSEFFITFKRLNKLNGKHTVFGQAVESKANKATLKALARAGSSQGKPRKKIEIEKARLVVESKAGASGDS